MHLHNNKIIKKNRKKLRTHGTSAEAVLWNSLKNRNINGLKFRRQHSLGKYIMDFYCPSLKLCIELDGEDHYWQEGMERDKKKTNFLNSKNIHVIRFENKLVFEDLDFVIKTILSFWDSTTPSPDNLPRRMSGSTPPDPGGEFFYFQTLR